MRELICVAALILVLCHPGYTLVQAQKLNTIEVADNLFRDGKFVEAQRAYAAVLKAEPRNFQALRSLGSVSLLDNQLARAQKWLEQALAVDPGDRQAKALLAEVFYRRDDFQRTAPLLKALGREAAAKKLESFVGVMPYHTEGKSQITSLKFGSTDPLPVIRVRVNDGEEANFIIDTGGSEVILDPEFARAVKAQEFGAELGKAYAGGQQAAYQHGRIDSITLGEFKVENVPVHIQSTRQFSAAAGGKRVDGVLGTVLLYHFLPTLDYQSGELILRRKTNESSKHLIKEAQTRNEASVPFWMAGDHYMVAWGGVNDSQPLLFLIDTGLAGGGFVCPDATVKEADIKLQGQAVVGNGGGGRVSAIPFVVDKITLGDAREENIRGFAGVFPPSLENMFGFRIGGLVSHQFFRPYALTIDFTSMKLLLKRKDK